MKYIYIILLILSFSFSHANDLVISTTPDNAEIRIRRLTDTTSRKAGQSPFKMPLSQLLSSYASGSDMFMIEVVKEGHEVYRTVLPSFVKADVSMQILLQPRADWEEYKKIDKAIAELFEAQRMIRSKNYDGAGKKIDEVEKNYPHLSITKELKASSYYLRNDYKKALDYYQQAYYANTENLDAYKMMVYLEKSMGVKKASGEKE